MKSYLSTRKQCVSVDGFKLPYLECQVGVPQDFILGPFLSYLYTSDLLHICRNVIHMYVDDAVIFPQAKNVQEASHILTSALTLTLAYQFVFPVEHQKDCMHNVFKTKQNKNEITQSDVFLREEELGIAQEFKYLGVIWDTPLSFKKLH